MSEEMDPKEERAIEALIAIALHPAFVGVEAMSGRPNEGRVKLTCYVLPLTAERIAYLVDKTKPDENTQGKIIDRQFGVQASKKVAGDGRKAPRGQHGRAKRSSSRAKRDIEQVERRAGVNP